MCDHTLLCQGQHLLLAVSMAGNHVYVHSNNIRLVAELW